MSYKQTTWIFYFQCIYFERADSLNSPSLPIFYDSFHIAFPFLWGQNTSHSTQTKQKMKIDHMLKTVFIDTSMLIGCNICSSVGDLWDGVFPEFSGLPNMWLFSFCLIFYIGLTLSVQKQKWIWYIFYRCHPCF